jgi:hypothetical protein
VRVGNWEKHGLSPPSAQEAKQQGGYGIQSNGLSGDEQDCDDGIRKAMSRLKVIQPFAQQMENQKKIAGDQNGINRQLNGKSSEVFRSFFFHAPNRDDQDVNKSPGKSSDSGLAALFQRFTGWLVGLRMN